MTDEVKNKALTAFLKNPYWKEIYEAAPEKCKALYELSFALAEKLIIPEEIHEKTIALYGEFSDADWDYLIENTQNKMGKWGYKKAREKWGKKSESVESK